MQLLGRCCHNFLKSPICCCISSLFKTDVRPILAFASPVWNLGFLGQNKLIKLVQCPCTKQITGLADFPYQERFARPELFSVKERLVRQALIHCYHNFLGLSIISPTDIFTESNIWHNEQQACHSNATFSVRSSETIFSGGIIAKSLLWCSSQAGSRKYFFLVEFGVLWMNLLTTSIRNRLRFIFIFFLRTEGKDEPQRWNSLKLLQQPVLLYSSVAYTPSWVMIFSLGDYNTIHTLCTSLCPVFSFSYTFLLKF